MSSLNTAAIMLNLLSEDSDAEELSTTASVTAARIAPDDTWENVDGEDEAHDDEGILIVPPVEVVPPVVPPVPTPQEGPSVASSLHPASPLNVSALLSSSVLREVEGLHLSGELVHSNTANAPPESNGPTAVAALSTPSEASDELVLVLNPRVAIRRSWLLPLVLGALLAASLATNVALMHQRSTLRLSLLASKLELLGLERTIQAKPPRPEPVHTKPIICECDEKPREDTKTLVDNCWVSAKANVRLGSCVEEARKELHDKVDRFGKGLWNFKEQLVNLFHPHDDGPSSNNRHPASSSNVMGGVSFQGVRDAATMLMSGVAYAAVATLIAEELHPPKEPKEPMEAHEALKKGSRPVRQSSSNRTP